MNELECRRAGELLPELDAGGLDADAATWLRAHVAGCASCAHDLALVRRVRAGAAASPAELAARIQAAVREDAAAGSHGRGFARDAFLLGRRRVWGVATAAALIVGVAGTLVVQRVRAPSEAELWQAFADEEPPVWVSDDGMIAGAPMLEDLSDLSDEDIAVVLQELGP